MGKICSVILLIFCLFSVPVALKVEENRFLKIEQMSYRWSQKGEPTRMKKIIIYVLTLFACAWLINQAVKLISEVWEVLFLSGVFLLVGWFIFHIIKLKKWR